MNDNGGNKMDCFCPFCEKTTPAHVVDAVVAHTIKGVDVTVNARLVQCDACGGQFNSPELDQDIAAMALEAYREKAGLLKPDEIREFRATFDLTQQELAKILGWGPATLSRYENGAPQDEAHDRALRMIMRPETLLAELAERPDVLAPARRERLLEQLRSRAYQQTAYRWFIREYVGDYAPNVSSGYRTFDPARFKAMVLHFCKDPGVPRTKLNKLLWYADFLAFRQNTTSISGARYAHLPHGPAPDNFDTLFAWLSGPEGVLRLDEASSGNLAWELLVATETPDYGQFSNSELALLAQVAEKFKDATARKMSDLSHKEPGYEQTRDGEIISYEFAHQMRAALT
jgi:putative zinc finger/helix-turn-helix YgiT family protein